MQKISAKIVGIAVLSFAFVSMLLFVAGVVFFIYLQAQSDPSPDFAVFMAEDVMGAMKLNIAEFRRTPGLRDEVTEWERSFIEQVKCLGIQAKNLKIRSFYNFVNEHGDNIQVYDFENPVQSFTWAPGRFQVIKTEFSDVYYDQLFPSLVFNSAFLQVISLQGVTNSRGGVGTTPFVSG